MFLSRLLMFWVLLAARPPVVGRRQYDTAGRVHAGVGDPAKTDLACGGSDFTYAESGQDSESIRSGISEWFDQIREGNWGTWLQSQVLEIDDLERDDDWGSLLRRLVDNSPASHVAGTFSEPVLDAWSILASILLVVAGSEGDPKLVASFSKAGEMQSLGVFRYDKDEHLLSADLAVSRYALSLQADHADFKHALKGAGRSLIAGWIYHRHSGEALGSEADLIIQAFPFSDFVRQHYIENGATKVCESQKCEASVHARENCGCALQIRVPIKCAYFFRHGLCGSLASTKKVLGVLRGCYGMDGKFKGK